MTKNKRSRLRQCLHTHETCVLMLSERFQIIVPITKDSRELFLSFKILGIWTGENNDTSFLLEEDKKEYLFTFSKEGRP